MIDCHILVFGQDSSTISGGSFTEKVVFPLEPYLFLFLGYAIASPLSVLSDSGDDYLLRECLSINPNWSRPNSSPANSRVTQKCRSKVSRMPIFLPCANNTRIRKLTQFLFFAKCILTILVRFLVKKSSYLCYKSLKKPLSCIISFAVCSGMAPVVSIIRVFGKRCNMIFL